MKPSAEEMETVERPNAALRSVKFIRQLGVSILTSSFPSWTSRVRSPSPALRINNLPTSERRRTPKYSIKSFGARLRADSPLPDAGPVLESYKRSDSRRAYDPVGRQPASDQLSI